jgi:hypothetical protein
MTSANALGHFSSAHTLPPVLSSLSGERRKRLEVRRQVPQIVWATTRPSPRVSKVEADLNATFFRQGNRAPELIVSVVPAKHDVLPEHANAGSDGVAMEARPSIMLHTTSPFACTHTNSNACRQRRPLTSFMSRVSLTTAFQPRRLMINQPRRLRCQAPHEHRHPSRRSSRICRLMRFQSKDACNPSLPTAIKLPLATARQAG